MNTRRSARRHHGRHRQVDRSPSTKAVEALARKRVSEYETLIPDGATRKVLEFWRDTPIEKPLFVYFIQAEDGPVKIGKAHDPVGRLRELQCGNPRTLVIRALVLASVQLEQDLHQSWGRVCGVRGEWFGHGYEGVLVQLAIEAAVRQIEDFAEGFPLHDITENAGSLMSPYWLKEKAA